jgi:two-component system chemotaxis sensor kinase CheA
MGQIAANTLSGQMEWDSRGGKGTRATIVLTLTYAIIDGFLVCNARENYVIPLTQVMECVELDES